jgi:hypothetical protein
MIGVYFRLMGQNVEQFRSIREYTTYVAKIIKSESSSFSNLKNIFVVKKKPKLLRSEHSNDIIKHNSVDRVRLNIHP